MHHDLKGEQHNKGSMVIELRDFGVRYDGRDLQPDNGPHEVPRWFGFELVSSGRAREVVPRPAPKEVVHGDPAISVGDPAPVTGDPQVRPARSKGKK